MILLPQQHQQQPSSCPSQECTRPPWQNKAPSLMHAGRRMRFPPPSTRQRSTMPTKPKKPGSQTVGSSAHWLVGSLACWLVGSLAHWLVSSLAHWIHKAPSSMNAGRRMRIPPPSTGRTEYNADEADEIRDPNNWLVSSLARRLVSSLAHRFTKR